MKIQVTVLLCIALLAIVASSLTVRRSAVAADRRKHLAGAPSEFADHVLPNPTQQRQRSEGAMLPVAFGKPGAVRAGAVVWSREVPVDSNIQFACSVFSPVANVEVRFRLPNQRVAVLGEALLPSEQIVKELSFGLTDEDLPSTTYVFTNPPVGIWTIEVSATQEAAAAFLDDEKPDAILLLDNETPYEIFTYLHSYDLLTGNTIGIDALMSSTKSVDAPIKGIISIADVDLTLPDGKSELLPMNDEGFGLDSVANDGVFVAAAALTETGAYRARVELSGKTSEGVEFLRTSQLLFETVAPDLTLSGAATASQNTGDSFLTFQLAVKWADVNAADQTYYAYTEVWGTDASKALVPVAWIGGMTDVSQASNGEFSLQLQLEKEWLSLAGAAAPFVLRNVYVQDRMTHVPMSRVAEIAVTSDPSLTLTLTDVLNTPFNGVPTERMRWGERPIELRNGSNGDGVVMLVHGYCTAAPGPFTRGDFTNVVAFEDYSANRKMDEFAQMVMNFGEQFPAFSIVSHSQGGLASLHLHTFYWSKLETAGGGRILQSVGSPYRGTALAGSLAAIGDVFGVGCGTQSEMTHDGAALWRTTLPKDMANHVYYYTSQYSTSGLIHYCNMAANAVLSWPNDGTTEIEYNDLNGANFGGNKKGWCHSTSMHHPPQCTDSARNTEMNANAAR